MGELTSLKVILKWTKKAKKRTFRNFKGSCPHFFEASLTSHSIQSYALASNVVNFAKCQTTTTNMWACNRRRLLTRADKFSSCFPQFSVCREFSVCQCSDARITVSHPASLRRRRTGWSRAPASSSWRRSRSWRRRWTGTWTGSAKQVRRADQPGQQLPFSSFEIENRFPDFFWPVESEGPRIGQNLSCTLSPVSSFTSGQWWRTLALSNPLPRHRSNNGLGWLLVCFPRLSMTPRPA